MSAWRVLLAGLLASCSLETPEPEEPVLIPALRQAASLVVSGVRAPAVLQNSVIVVSDVGLHVAPAPTASVEPLPAPVAQWPKGAVVGAPLVLPPAGGAEVVVPIAAAGACELRGFDRAGVQYWVTAVGNGACHGVAIHEGTLYATSDDVIRAIAAADGTPGASVGLSTPPTTGPALLPGGTQLVMGSDTLLRVFALHPLALAEEVDVAPHFLTAAVPLGGSQVVATARLAADGDDSGYGDRLLRVDLSGDPGKQVALTITTPGLMTAPPVAAADCPGRAASGGAHWWCGAGVIASGGAHWLEAYDATTGAAIAKGQANSGSTTGLALGADGRIYSGGAHWLEGWRLRTLDPAAPGGATDAVAGWLPTLQPVLGASPALLCDGRAVDVALSTGGTPYLVSAAVGSPGHPPGAWVRSHGDAGNARHVSAAECTPEGVWNGSMSLGCGEEPSVAPLPSMTTARGFGCGAYYGGRVFAIGGVDQKDGEPFGSAIAASEALDLATGVWSPIAPLPVPTAGAACAAIGGRIIVAGGWSGDWTASVHTYEIATDTWHVAPSLPTPRAWSGVAVHRGALYLAGGVGSNDTYLSAVDAHRLTTQSWVPAGSLSSGRYGVGLGVFDDSLLAFGGDAWVDGENVVSDAVERLNDTGGWALTGHLDAPRSSLRPLNGPAGPALMHWSTLLALTPQTWTTNPTLELPPSAHSFQSVVVETPVGVVVAGGGAWGPNVGDTWLLCP